VKELIHVLTKNFEGELKNESQGDQNRFDLRKGNHQTCINHKNRRFQEHVGDVWRAAAAIDTKADKHKKCRKFQKTLQRLTTQSAKVGDGTWDTLAKADITERTQLCGEISTFDTDKAAYKDAEPANHVSDSCSIDQSVHEESHCLWMTLKKSACTSFDDCIAAVDLNSTKEEIEDRIDNRKDIFQSISKLKCRLRHINYIYNNSKPVSDNNKTDNCEKTFPNPPEFDLSLTFPNAVPCSGDHDITTGVLYPSTLDAAACASWRQAKYDFSSLHVQVQNCQFDCTIPDDNVNPNPPQPGCLDLDGICEFYTQHWTACGKYSDDAQTKCCACGGGQTPTPEPTPAPTPSDCNTWSYGTKGYCACHGGCTAWDWECNRAVTDQFMLNAQHTKAAYRQWIPQHACNPGQHGCAPCTATADWVCNPDIYVCQPTAA
jgi:hypothetical protein